MRKYAIFIEPQAELREEILLTKNLVELNLPGQKYCNHPPHCTVIFGAYEEPHCWINALQVVAESFSPFLLTTEGYYVFYNDRLAGGGHTLVIKAALSPLLSQLQISVSEILSRHKIEALSISKHPDNDPISLSLARYGFPFVGNHWVPHFSIASLKIRRNAKILRQIVVRPQRYSFQVDELSVWKVDEDNHEKMYSVRLKGETK